ncbi:MAG: hypothetical protein LBS84_01105 [Clostridiales bacterium]|nr:hypothetical protein [Clostridiales bacterium]
MGKLLVGVVIFSVLSNIGEYSAGFAAFFTSPLALPITMLLGILYVVLPTTMSYALMVAVIGIQLSSNIEVAALTVLFLLCLLFFYIRLAPKESILILLTIAAFYFKIPYLVPLLAGLYCGVTALIPIGVGVFLWDLLPVMKLLLTYKTAGLDVMEMPNTLGELLPAIFDNVLAHQEWIFTAFIFAMVVLAVYGISRINLDYAKDISVGLGAVLTVVSFIIANVLAGMEVDIPSTILYVVISAIIAEIARFFDVVLDYSRSERVEFEDEDNYYFVKVVPKVLLAKRAHSNVARAREEFEE